MGVLARKPPKGNGTAVIAERFIGEYKKTA
jgi:hypothetical protein